MNLKSENITDLISRNCLFPVQTVISVFELLNLLQSKILLKDSFVKCTESRSNKTAEAVKTPVVHTKAQLAGNLELTPLPSILGEKDITMWGFNSQAEKGQRWDNKGTV